MYNNKPADAAKSSDAPVTHMKMKEYIDTIKSKPSDLRIFFYIITDKLPELLKNFTYPDLGMKFFKRLPTLFFGGSEAHVLDPRAAAAFMLARCAPEDRYYPLVDVLFKQQEQWAASANAVEPLMQISKLAGFTQESFNACLTNQKLLDDVNASRDRGAKDFGVNATPTFFINGTKYAGALSVDEMSAIIDGLL